MKNFAQAGLRLCRQSMSRGIPMKYQPIPDEQAYKDLDGALVNPDTIDESKLPNLDYYFVGAALGFLFFISCIAFVIRAAVYLLNWHSFLQSAYLTKCNVFYYVKIQKVTDTPYRGEVSRHYFSFYTLKVCYIDESGQKKMKEVKYLTAHNLATKLSPYFVPEGDKYSLYEECIVVYHKSDKLRLIF